MRVSDSAGPSVGRVTACQILFPIPELPISKFSKSGEVYLSLPLRWHPAFRRADPKNPGFRFWIPKYWIFPDFGPIFCRSKKHQKSSTSKSRRKVFSIDTFRPFGAPETIFMLKSLISASILEPFLCIFHHFAITFSSIVFAQFFNWFLMNFWIVDFVKISF